MEKYNLPLRYSGLAFLDDLHKEGEFPDLKQLGHELWASKAAKSVDYTTDFATIPHFSPEPLDGFSQSEPKTAALQPQAEANGSEERVAAGSSDSDSSSEDAVDEEEELAYRESLQLISEHSGHVPDDAISNAEVEAIADQAHTITDAFAASEASTSTSTSTSTSGTDDTNLTAAEPPSPDDEFAVDEFDEEDGEDDAFNLTGMALEQQLSAKTEQKFGFPFEMATSQTAIRSLIDRADNMSLAEQFDMMKQHNELDTYGPSHRPHSHDAPLKFIHHTYYEPMGSHSTQREERRVTLLVDLDAFNLPEAVKYVTRAVNHHPPLPPVPMISFGKLY
jgi:hypothetical protein